RRAARRRTSASSSAGCPSIARQRTPGARQDHRAVVPPLSSPVPRPGSRGAKEEQLSSPPTMELEIPATDVDGWIVLAASGEIDVAAAPALREKLGELVEAGTTQVVVDLEGVDFIDSTGLGVLVGAVRRARAAGGDVRL